MKDPCLYKTIPIKTNHNLLNLDILQRVEYILDMDYTKNYHLSNHFQFQHHNYLIYHNMNRKKLDNKKKVFSYFNPLSLKY